MTQAKLGETVGTTRAVCESTFVQMLEALGYDIQLNYVKREE